MDTAIINIHSAEYLPRDEWLCITLIGGKSWWGDSKVSRVACFGMDSEAMIEKSTSHSALWNQNSSTCDYQVIFFFPFVPSSQDEQTNLYFLSKARVFSIQSNSINLLKN